MKTVNGDSIKFESGEEVNNIVNALEEFITMADKSVWDDDMLDVVRQMKRKLLGIETNWQGRGEDKA